MENELGRNGFAVIYGPCGWESVPSQEFETLEYANQSGWFILEEEAEAHAAQLRG